MKKIQIIILVMLFSTLLMANIFTVKQDGSGDFMTIQEGIDSPLVADLDTLIVFLGTYNENIIFSKNLLLTSPNPNYIDSTIILGNDSGVGIHITDYAHGSICDLTIQNFEVGIRINDRNYSHIYNCVIKNNTQNGIEVVNGFDYYTESSVIEKCQIFNNGQNGELGNRWTESEKSPCINSACLDYGFDPDGTWPDMGAIYHPCDYKEYEFVSQQEWNWLCFDILDIYEPTTTNQIQNFLDPIKFDLILGKQEDLEFSYDIENGWQNGGEVISSPLGYKILMEEERSLDVSGFRCPANTTFNIYANPIIGDWIGYFVDKTQHVYDAFDGYLDNIYSIQHKDWSVRGSENGWPDVPYTLSPGDMVVVKCEEYIEHFCWLDQEESERYTVPETQNFSYTEEADYIPIYVELEETNLPDEIGVIVDGECKGAKVVDDDFVDICAYITETQTGNVELEFSYGNRGVNTTYKEYVIFDPDTGYREKTAIDLNNKLDHYYVSFRTNEDETSSIPQKLTITNYPNPFNPVTTISYSLPQKTDMLTLEIYNIKGQKVKTLLEGEHEAGTYQAIWSGRDDNDKQAASGIYFYKLSTPEHTLMKKMLLLK